MKDTILSASFRSTANLSIPAKDPNASFLLHAGLLCNDAKLEESGEEQGAKSYRIVGDPTEGAMVVAAAKAGIWRDGAEKALRRVQEIPFDSDRKRMTTIHQMQAAGQEFLVSTVPRP